MTDKPRTRLCAVELDSTIGPGPSPEAEHERRVAVFDLVEKNSFEPSGAESGPYRLKLSLLDTKLVFDIEGPDFARAHGLSLTPLKGVIRDYILICDSYYEALRGTSPAQIEAVDMGRRGLHDEGSRLLKSELAGRIEIDHDTARRLFTLLCILHIRG